MALAQSLMNQQQFNQSNSHGVTSGIGVDCSQIQSRIIPTISQTRKLSVAASDVTDDGPRKNFELLKISYDARLHTFKDCWSVSYIKPEELARAGFFYTGYSDIVSCPYCRVDVGKWEQGDNPYADHAKWSPTCRFLESQRMGEPQPPASSSNNGNSESNNAANANSSNASGQDTCGKYGIIHSRTSIPENSSLALGANNTISSDLTSIGGIQQVKTPSFRHYATLERRFETFADWPVSIAQKPKDLAEAGFFYTGKSDQTVCFHCGGGLKDWESADLPWQQHARWFPKCPFVVLQKGIEYISEQQPNATSSACAAPEFPVRRSSAPDTPTAEPEQPETKQLDDKEDPLDKTPNSVLCKICYSKEVGVVFLPCGHMVACVDCAPVLTTCAVCRKPVEAHIRAFLS